MDAGSPEPDSAGRSPIAPSLSHAPASAGSLVFRSSSRSSNNQQLALLGRKCSRRFGGSFKANGLRKISPRSTPERLLLPQDSQAKSVSRADSKLNRNVNEEKYGEGIDTRFRVEEPVQPAIHRYVHSPARES
ncbi:hypothetical protein E2C01_045918 [Portunus trituberculatus]|uniref:Uncharacterized protein n=1 Tax=Portunus trituberculatus TaxID=210409 RepID=A0A5B7G4E2_PORTR|nr:hypothetical protein [Portunus trituberculatus]